MGFYVSSIEERGDEKPREVKVPVIDNEGINSNLLKALVPKRRS